MAPNKKKKKPVANPARGFATVSVASKVKDIIFPDDSATSCASDATINPDEIDGPSHPPTNVERDLKVDHTTPIHIQDMSPEELEAHLEDSELQSLLDASSLVCKADASRQVSRLRAERRQLRAQAYALNTRIWLEDDVVDQLLLASGRLSPLPNVPTNPFSSSNPQRLLDLWTLQRVLLALNLDHIAEVMEHVVLLAIRSRVTADTGLIWGLGDAFDWYTCNIPGHGLLDYDTEHQEAALFGEDQGLLHTDSKDPTLEDAAQPAGNSMHLETSTEDVSQSEDISDHDDDDLDLLIATYLRLKRELWKRKHKLNSQEKKNDVKLRKLQDRVSAIERDMLFDMDAAQTQWLPIELKLEIDKGKKRKIAKTAVRGIPVGANNDEMTDERSGAEDGKDDGLFGDMFTAPGENLGENQESSSINKTVRLVNFGRWSGLSPRQLLEQTSRSIDSRARLKTFGLSQTPSSARHKIMLLWSGPQRVPTPLTIASLPVEVVSDIKVNQWSIEMDSIAASSAEQSTSYVSNLMLFLVLSLTTQEQQSILRLPTVWRDEFAKLARSRKSLVNDGDKAELRELRKLIKMQESMCENTAFLSRENGTPISAGTLMTTRPKTFELRRQNHEEVISSWASRATSAAFRKMQTVRDELPIHSHKDLILQSIAENPVTIVCAETGSGKSTQTGSFLLEENLSSGTDCRILVTQPRRISAISLAQRVSLELGEAKGDLGTLRSLVGYAIRLESKTSASTRLTFATTGVLLRMLESSPDLEQLDYLILDEVHERTIEMDLLFIALRRLHQRQSSLKIILMSATVDARKFSSYFGNAPILNIPGRMFPVDVRFLEDAIESTNGAKSDFSVPLESEEISEEDESVSRSNSPSALTSLESYSAATRKRLSSMDEYRIDYDLITKLATAIATKPIFMKYSSAILIFMPGIAEIRRLFSALSGTDCFRNNWDIHMLHSSFSTEELERAFAVPPQGRRKIVIATNIAETGITLPDVTAVIDTCKEKVMRFDERRQLSKLAQGFVSRSSAKQRRGRAARVQDGLCFHLVTRHRHDNQMLEQQVPEMMRLSLQDPILRVKIWNLGSIEDAFQAAIDPPSRKNVLRAIGRLKDAGALTRAENLTALGQRIARLPLDVTFAKLAILSAIFECVDPVLTMISILTSKPIFLATSARDQKSAFARTDPRAMFARSESDILTSLAAYEGWRKSKDVNKSGEFCRKNHLSEQNLLDVEDQKVQLIVYLVDGGLMSLDSEEKAALNKTRASNIRRRDFYQVPPRYNKPVGDDLLLSLIAMSFYPRILTREGKGWRNVYTNQQVSLRKESVNHGVSRPPTWLSFSEAMQTKTGNLNVFETSRIPDVALAVLLGGGDKTEVNMFAGVLVLDNGRVKVAVKGWRQALALKQIRKGVNGMLERRYKRMEESMSDKDAYWVELVRTMTMG